jgi:aminoglycoside phosphotransferase (APT) family kinase protein
VAAVHEAGTLVDGAYVRPLLGYAGDGGSGQRSVRVRSVHRRVEVLEVLEVRGLNMATHELALSGDRMVKRYASWQRGEHRREWAVLVLVHAHTTDLVPEPLGARLDAIPPTLTMGVVPGEPLSGALTDAQLTGLEKALRELWSVPARDLPPRRLAPAEAFSVARTRFATVGRFDGVVGEAVAAVRGYLVKLTPLPDHAESILGHSDPNLSNYLWDGSRVRIVDFEDAGRSDPAYELATLMEHLGARGTDWTEFGARLGVDQGRLREGRRLAASLWLHMLLPGGPSANRNPPGTLELQAKRLLDLLT